MTKHAYQFLFQDETLYRVPEPENPVAPVQNLETAKAGVLIESQPEPARAPESKQVREEEPVRPQPAPPVVKSLPIPVVPVVEPPKPIIPQINHQVLLLFDDELLPSELILLENILKAVNLNLNGVDVLNLANSGLVNVRPVLASKRVHHFISFGVPFTKLNLNIALNRYEIRNLAGINFMLADPLSAIEADRALKKQLWLTLQQIFLNV